MTKIVISFMLGVYGLTIIAEALTSPVDQVLKNKFVMIILGSLFYHLSLLRWNKDKYYDDKGLKFNWSKYRREHFEEWGLTCIWAFIVGGNGPELYYLATSHFPVINFGTWDHLYYLGAGLAGDFAYFIGKYGIPTAWKAIRAYIAKK